MFFTSLPAVKGDVFITREAGPSSVSTLGRSKGIGSRLVEMNPVFACCQTEVLDVEAVITFAVYLLTRDMASRSHIGPDRRYFPSIHRAYRRAVTISEKAHTETVGSRRIDPLG